MNPDDRETLDKYLATHDVHPEVAERLPRLPWRTILAPDLPLTNWRIAAMAEVIAANLHERGIDIPLGKPPRRQAPAYCN